MYAQADGAFEDTIVGLDEDALHIHVEFLRYDLGDLVYHTYAIDAIDLERYGEIK